MGGKLEDLFLNRAKFVMKIFGVWMPPLEESSIRKCYRIYTITMQYILLSFQFIYLGQVWGDVDAVSQALYVLFTEACLCFKITVFHVNIKILRQLLDQMNSDIFKPKSYVHEMILKSQATNIKRILLVFLVSAQLTCALWGLKPLFDDVGSRNFPLEMWMPVTSESSPQYELGFAFQLITICSSAYMYFGVDSVALSLIVFGRAQMDIIKDKIIKVSSVNYLAKAEERRRMYSENQKILVECVNHHQAVVTFSHQVEDAYHLYLLFQLAGSVGILGMTALRLLVVDWQSMQFLSIACYLFVMLCQLLTCSWCGHELTCTCEELHTVIYECLWYEQDMRFKRDLCFAMMRMSRPVVLRAGHYITLSRQTFVAILRLSYSYFAVLNQAHKD